MMRNHWITRVLALAVLAVVLGARAEAATIYVSPASQPATTGGAVSADVWVAGLTGSEAVGGFAFQLLWNPAILTGTGYTPDPAGTMGLGLDLSFGFGLGVLDLYYIAEDFGPAGPGPEEFAALKPAQGATFKLATVNFLAVGPGLTPLTLDIPPGYGLSNADGTALLPITGLTDGEVCVDCGPAVVPEPATLSLLGTGVATLIARRRRQNRKRA